jgi:hypothetical protein
VSKGDDGAGELEEGVIEVWVAFVTNDESTEVTQPGKGAFDFPAVAIAAQRAAVLGGRLLASLSVGADQLDALVC